jgi:hypothetical protein
MKTILSLVPRLPPAIDGVGDYALLLSQNLADRHQIFTQFINCDPIESESKDPSQIQLTQRSTDALLTILDGFDNIDTLFLHYVGYGYAKRGCPLWLLAALSKWRNSRSSRRLVIMFHEVYASSNLPWNSQFWTSPIQKQIAKDLVILCDRVITNSQIFAHTISKLSSKHDGKILSLPIFSNIGECPIPIPLKERQHWLVTFGNSGFRKSIYTNSLEQVTIICQQLGIEEIYDIGHNSAEIVREIPGIKMNPMGILPAAEISQIFGMAQVGFINYPITYIAKSGIFAAYASHQLCTVFERDNLGDNQDGIELNKHYWTMRDGGDIIDLDLAQSIAGNAYQWYNRHNLEQTASHIATILNSI